MVGSDISWNIVLPSFVSLKILLRINHVIRNKFINPIYDTCIIGHLFTRAVKYLILMEPMNINTGRYRNSWFVSVKLLSSGKMCHKIPTHTLINLRVPYPKIRVWYWWINRLNYCNAECDFIQNDTFDPCVLLP